MEGITSPVMTFTVKKPIPITGVNSYYLSPNTDRNTARISTRRVCSSVQPPQTPSRPPVSHNPSYIAIQSAVSVTGEFLGIRTETPYYVVGAGSDIAAGASAVAVFVAADSAAHAGAVGLLPPHAEKMHRENSAPKNWNERCNKVGIWRSSGRRTRANTGDRPHRSRSALHPPCLAPLRQDRSRTHQRQSCE